MGTTTTTPTTAPRDPFALKEVAGIRYFENATLQRQVENAVASIPAGHQFAIVAHGERGEDGKAKADLSAVVKLGDKWSISVGGYKKFGGEWGGGGKLVWSPF